MKLITTLLVLSIAFLIPYLDSNNYQLFLYGSGYTVYMEILIFIWVMRYRMLKRIKTSKLTIGFKSVIHLINQSTNFQAYIPDDSDKSNASSLSLTSYEPSVVDIHEDQIIDEVQGAQKSRIQHQADIYLNQIKNYFGSQKLSLIKLDRKGTLQKYQCVTNLTDSLLSYYSNLEKAFDIQQQASILSKFSKKEQISVLEQIDQKEQHLVQFQTISAVQQEFINKIVVMQGRNVNLPQWLHIKQQVRLLCKVFQQQQYQISKVAKPQIQQIQKTYMEEYKNIKKIKSQTQTQHDDVFRRKQNLEGQKSLIEKDLEALNTQYKELKKNKSDPEKLIKMEMQIKLSAQQLQTVQLKLKNTQLEEIDQSTNTTKTNEQLNQFKDNWDRQFIVMYQTVIRSLLQTHYDNYYSYFKSFKNVLRLQQSILSQSRSLSVSQMASPTQLVLRQQRTVSIDEIDPPRLMRNEKEDLSDLINKFKNYDDQIALFEKYDSECLDFFVEIADTIRKVQADDLKIQLLVLKDIWITENFTKGFPKNLQFYQNLYTTIKSITTNFVENRSKLYKEYKETSVSVKERINNITYLFNCILKDSEKFNPQKVDGFTDYQRLKQQFKQNYLQYQQESESLKKKLNQYETKYKQYVEQHAEILSTTKFQFILSFATLSKDISSHTMRMIDEFDEKYEQQDQIVKSLLVRQPSFSVSDDIQMKQVHSLFNNNTTTIPKTSSRSNSQNAKIPTDSLHQLKETFVLRQLIKVLFQQWTKSLYFRQKFMTELYRSLNKKRPSQLDEIYVTNIDIGGDPPEVLQFIPQKSKNSCVFDLELSFRGYFYMELETFVNISWAKKHLPVNIKVKITSLNGRLRLCYTPNFIGKSWVSFVGEPQMNISIEPTISKYNISVANDIIKEFLIYKIKMLTYPNKETITVPLAEFETEIPQSALNRIQQFVNKMKE